MGKTIDLEIDHFSTKVKKTKIRSNLDETARAWNAGLSLLVITVKCFQKKAAQITGGFFCFYQLLLKAR